MGLTEHRLRSTDAAKSAPASVNIGVAVIKISTFWDVDLLQVKPTLVLWVIYSFACLLWGTTMTAETIRLLEIEGVR